ncbi:MAG: dTMP kinase [Armatimonadota bacterium]
MSSPSDIAIPPHVRFVVLEGVDRSGKSTQARLLAEWLQASGFRTVLTREPGGTPLGERLRPIILDPAIPCAPRTELMLILAARAQHVAEVIRPALQDGAMVVSDRYTPSSLAYQGYGRGLPLEEIRAADAAATGGLRPDLTLVIDVPIEVVLPRMGERADRFEGEGREFLQRVIAGYRRLAAEDPAIHLIDGTGSVEAVQQAIRDMLCSMTISERGGETR